MKLKRNDELIPKRLKKLREEKGWSQTQAGDAIGAGRGAWQQWELRKRTPSDTGPYRRFLYFQRKPSVYLRCG